MTFTDGGRLHNASRKVNRIAHYGEPKWDFRLVRSPDGGLGLHVVFYDKAGFVQSIVPEPATFECDSDQQRGELINELQQALYGARDKPIIDMGAAGRREAR